MMIEDLFKPWEIEDISCINTFMEQKCKEVFDSIRWDVDENNPKFDRQGPLTPPGAFDLIPFRMRFYA
jgi:hypothetical protein